MDQSGGLTMRYKLRRHERNGDIYEHKTNDPLTAMSQFLQWLRLPRTKWIDIMVMDAQGYYSHMDYDGLEAIVRSLIEDKRLKKG